VQLPGPRKSDIPSPDPGVLFAFSLEQLYESQIAQSEQAEVKKNSAAAGPLGALTVRIVGF
jgi:hypothetical protein